MTCQRETPPTQPVFPEDHPEAPFFLIDVSLITTDPDQPRKHFFEQSRSDLCESIRKTGVLQPVLIRKDTDDKIWLVAGERRAAIYGKNTGNRAARLHLLRFASIPSAASRPKPGGWRSDSCNTIGIIGIAEQSFGEPKILADDSPDGQFQRISLHGLFD